MKYQRGTNKGRDVEKRRSSYKAYYYRHRDEILESRKSNGHSAQSRFQKTERGQAVIRKHHQTERYKETKRRYHQSDSYKAIKKRYRRSERGRLAAVASSQKRRAIKKTNTNGLITLVDLNNLKQQCKGHCFYCGEKRPLTFDHFVPLINGGKHEITNLVCACLSCNSKKQAKDPRSFLKELGRLL